MRRHGEERDRPEPQWCPKCVRMVTPKPTDFGIGPYECHGRRGWHKDIALACPDCESTKLEESAPEMECRRCGEVERLTEPGVCESCFAHLRNLPGARL